MNNSTYFYLGFTMVSIAGYLTALLARAYFSDANYTPSKFWLAFTYNMILGFFHYRFAQTGKLPILGHTDNSIMGWLSLALTVLHLCSMPVPKRRRWWFSRKKFNPRIRK